MTDWLKDFKHACLTRPLNSCSCSRDCDNERLAAYAELGRLEKEIDRLHAGLLSLKGEEFARIPDSSWTATRTTSYVALNGAIDRILSA